MKVVCDSVSDVQTLLTSLAVGFRTSSYWKEIDKATIVACEHCKALCTLQKEALYLLCMKRHSGIQIAQFDCYIVFDVYNIT